MLQRAVEWQRLPQNPVKLVRKPQVRRLRDVRPLPPATVEQLRAAAGTAPVQGDRNATLISVLAYAGLRPQEALALTWGDVRHRTLLIDKASDGEGGVKPTKTGQSRTVRLLGPLAADLMRWRLASGRPDDAALVFPSPSGGVWNDAHWQTWHRDVWRRACKRVRVTGVRPYDLRHGFVSLLIQEGRHVVDVARQAGHSPTMTLDVYGHVFDEFDPAERVPADEQIRRARDVSEKCPPNAETEAADTESPANDYNPRIFPKISFMISSVPPPMGPSRVSRTARSISYSFM